MRTKFATTKGHLHDDHIIHCYAIGYSDSGKRYIYILQTPTKKLIEIFKEMTTILAVAIFSSTISIKSEKMKGISIIVDSVDKLAKIGKLNKKIVPGFENGTSQCMKSQDVEAQGGPRKSCCGSSPWSHGRTMIMIVLEH